MAVIQSLLENSQQSVAPDDLYDIVSKARDSYKEGIINALKPYLSSSPSPRLQNDIVDQCARSYQHRVHESLLNIAEALGRTGGFQQDPMDAPPSYKEGVSASATGSSFAGSSTAYPVNSINPIQFDDEWILDSLIGTSDFYKVNVFQSLVDRNTKVSADFLQRVVAKTSDFYKTDVIRAIKPYLGHKLTPQEVSKISSLSSNFYKGDVLTALRKCT